MSAEEAEIMAAFNAQLLELESQMHNPENMSMRDEIIARNMMPSTEGFTSASDESTFLDRETSSNAAATDSQYNTPPSSNPSPQPCCSSSILPSQSCPNFPSESSQQCSSSDIPGPSDRLDSSGSYGSDSPTPTNSRDEGFDPILGCLDDVPEDLDPEVAALLGELYNATQECSEEARCKKRTLSQSQSCPSFSAAAGPASKRFEQCERPKKHGVFEDLITDDDFECKLCFELMFNPVTTPCGHVFCRDCLFRTIDHSPNCPVCRLSLTPYVSAGKKDVTQVLNQMLELFFEEKHKANQSKYKERMSKLAR